MRPFWSSNRVSEAFRAIVLCACGLSPDQFCIILIQIKIIFAGASMSTAASDLPSTKGERQSSPLRFVTAASLFDGHDAAINIMRRLIQAQGVEVVHLGHNRSVDDIVLAAIQEDADGIAVSSYQGGHNEFFRYMVDRLRG